MNVHDDDVPLKAVQPNLIVSKTSFNDNKCPLLISASGNVTALYRYTNAGPFIELFRLSYDNLIPALKYAIKQGAFCHFDFGKIEHVDDIVRMLEILRQTCARTHEKLYDHIIHNSLLKQSYDDFLTLIPFDSTYELVPAIYDNHKESCRLLFFAQIECDSLLADQSSSLSLFKCIRVQS
jgi:hypothetical protein